MKKVKFNSKKAESMMWAFSHYYGRTLEDVYKNPSYYKVRSYEAIKNEMLNCNGHGLTVTGANCNFYSVAYIRPNADNSITLVYHTYANIFEIDINESILTSL